MSRRSESQRRKEKFKTLYLLRSRVNVMLQPYSRDVGVFPITSNYLLDLRKFRNEFHINITYMRTMY